ncbi:MAG: hypothetical protein ACI8ZM_000826 [Crocinitomix sp.]|jgi:hypothetical protein
MRQLYAIVFILFCFSCENTPCKPGCTDDLIPIFAENPFRSTLGVYPVLDSLNLTGSGGLDEIRASEIC